MSKLMFDDWCRELEKLFARQMVAKGEADAMEALDVAEMFVDNGRDAFREMYDEGMSPLEAIDEEAFAAGD